MWSEKKKGNVYPSLSSYIMIIKIVQFLVKFWTEKIGNVLSKSFRFVNNIIYGKHN